ncbi:MAG: thiamine diphosphokinase [Thermoguttaceae bacterium]|nr:thiamine diphosphokinase [Thermoguttaceae bacterium]
MEEFALDCSRVGGDDATERTALLANGAFPKSSVALEYFFRAPRLVCCDGASDVAIENGREPDYIVGDCDSASSETLDRLRDRVVRVAEQETNDLTKAFRFCLSKGWRRIVILGATGKREDHALGNMARLVDFAEEADVKMTTDDGDFYVLRRPGKIRTTPGAQISIFSFDPRQEIDSDGLKYPLKKLRLPRWWTATLNEATADSFSLDFDGSSPLLIYVARGR